MKESVRKVILTAVAGITIIWGISNPVIGFSDDFNQKLEDYNTSISIGDKQAAGESAMKVAQHLIENKEYKPALNYLEKARLLFLESKDLHFHRLACREKGILFVKQNQFESAIESFTEAISSSKSIQDNNAIASDIFELALVQKALGKNKTAYKNFLTANAYASKGTPLHLQKSIFLELIRTAQQIKKTKEALAHQSSLRKIEDQIFKLDKAEREKIIATIQDEKLKAEMEADLIVQQQNHELEIKGYEIDKLDKAIFEKDSTLNEKDLHLELAKKENLEHQMSLSLMSKEKELNGLKIKKLKDEQDAQRQLLYLIIVIAILISATAFVLFRSIRLHKEDKKQIKKKNKEIREQHGSIVESINYAQRIQEAMLPHSDNLKKHIPNHMIYFRPRDIVSGDFYWFYPLSRINKKGFLIAAIDCTGHGVPGALVSMIAANLLNRIVDKGTVEPGQILDQLHIEVGKALKQDKTENVDGMDMSLCHYLPETNELFFSGAKNGLVLISNGKSSYHKGESMPIGGNSKRLSANYTTTAFQLKQDDHIYLFSDGYQDQFGGEKDRKLSRKRLIELLVEIHQSTPLEQNKALDTTFNNWKGESKQIDDVLVLGFKV